MNTSSTGFGKFTSQNTTNNEQTKDNTTKNMFNLNNSNSNGTNPFSSFTSTSFLNTTTNTPGTNSISGAWGNKTDNMKKENEKNPFSGFGSLNQNNTLSSNTTGITGTTGTTEKTGTGGFGTTGGFGFNLNTKTATSSFLSGNNTNTSFNTSFKPNDTNTTTSQPTAFGKEPSNNNGFNFSDKTKSSFPTVQKNTFSFTDNKSLLKTTDGTKKNENGNSSQAFGGLASNSTSLTGSSFGNLNSSTLPSQDKPATSGFSNPFSLKPGDSTSTAFGTRTTGTTAVVSKDSTSTTGVTSLGANPLTSSTSKGFSFTNPNAATSSNKDETDKLKPSNPTTTPFSFSSGRGNALTKPADETNDKETSNKSNFNVSSSSITPSFSFGSSNQQQSTVSAQDGPPAEYNDMTLGEIIDHWREKLENQAASFVKNAEKIGEWDQMLLENQKSLNEISQKIIFFTAKQKEINAGISNLDNFHSELCLNLEKMEEKIDKLYEVRSQESSSVVTMADIEREKILNLSVDLDTQLNTMGKELEETTETLNNKYHFNDIQNDLDLFDNENQSFDQNDEGENEKKNNPIFDILKVLTVHQSSLEALERSANNLKYEINQVQHELCKH